MAVVTLKSLVGGDVLPKFAVDTDFPKDKVDFVFWKQVTGIDASASLTTILSLTGKFAINFLFMEALLANEIAQVKLTVDDIVVWDVDPVTNATTEGYIGHDLNVDRATLEPMMCQSSFLFQMKMDTDNSITLSYQARPIL